MAEKNCSDMTKLIFKSCVSLRCSGQELLARADKPGSTPGVAVLCFFFFFALFFFSVWSLFLLTLFPFGLFFFIHTADPACQALGSIDILSVSPVYLKISKNLHWVCFQKIINETFYWFSGYNYRITGVCPKLY